MWPFKKKKSKKNTEGLLIIDKLKPGESAVVMFGFHQEIADGCCANDGMSCFPSNGPCCTCSRNRGGA